jgi:cyclopropane fatty-acyl-phospholipid synthase-like methyltransferase
LISEILTTPSELAGAWSRQYDRVAAVFAELLGSEKQRIAEVGCGSGQLTVPLAKHSMNLRFILVDRFVGTNYSKNHKALLRNLRKARLTKRARIVVSDYMRWVTTQENEAYDGIITSEFVPELNSDETRQFIQECYRILKPEGVTIHSFLSPIPRNLRQRLLITADSNPLWTRTPPREWFSPKPELIARELRKAGFHRIRRNSIRAQLIMKADAAKSWLKDAEVRANFYEQHARQLNKDGLEVPDWIIVSGVRP